MESPTFTTNIYQNKNILQIQKTFMEVEVHERISTQKNVPQFDLETAEGFSCAVLDFQVCFSCQGGSFSAADIDDLQQDKEQGYNVQIEVESSKHILLRGHFVFPVFPAQYKLGIIHQELQGNRKMRCFNTTDADVRRQHVEVIKETVRVSVKGASCKENMGSISSL